MPEWNHKGHAIRRREGSPSSTYGSLKPGVKIPPGGSLMDLADYSAAISSMSQYGREAMGVNPMASLMKPPEQSYYHPELMQAKYANQSQDPALVPGASPRTPTTAERLGARFAVDATINPPVMPEAAATMSQARPIPSRVQRVETDSFGQGVDYSRSQ